MRILIAEDDRSIATAVKKSLMAANYAVDHVDNGPDAYDYIISADYDVIIMDIMMPGEDGLSVVQRARSAGIKIPILFLTARDAISDRVAGLDAGGDDYLVKPFALDELMARVRVLSRRAAGNAVATSELKLADLVVNTASQAVSRSGRSIQLTGREYTILEYMLRNQGIVLTRDQIEQNIFNYEYEGASNMVDVYIRYLRKKLDDGFEPKLIHTVRGVGYVMRVNA